MDGRVRRLGVCAVEQAGKVGPAHVQAWALVAGLAVVSAGSGVVVLVLLLVLELAAVTVVSSGAGLVVELLDVDSATASGATVTVRCCPDKQ